MMRVWQLWVSHNMVCAGLLVLAPSMSVATFVGIQKRGVGMAFHEGPWVWCGGVVWCLQPPQ